MSQHTPGPWLVDAEHAGLFEQDKARFWINASGTHVAYVDGPRNDERTANARLIAAAPDLLEALREVLPMLEHMLMIRGEPQPGSIGHKARAAIVKAMGEAA